MAGSQLGVRSGEEFRAARRAAEACDAQLVLGDRPIEVSLRRAWDALGWRQRWRLGKQLTGRYGSEQTDSLCTRSSELHLISEPRFMSSAGPAAALATRQAADR